MQKKLQQLLRLEKNYFSKNKTASRFSQPMSQQQPQLDIQQQIEQLVNQGQKTFDTKEYFQSLRIYQNHTSSDLRNLLLCTHVLNYEFIVKNSEKMYKLSSKIMGSNLINKIINKTVAKVYTGGNQLSDIPQIYENLKAKNVGLIVNYCDEVIEGRISEDYMDYATEQFVVSIQESQKVNSNVGIKYSGICDPTLMRKLNGYRAQQRDVFKKISEQHTLQNVSGTQLYQGLNLYGIKCTQEEIKDFCVQILKKNESQSLDEIQITRVQWECLVHPLYIDDALNNNSIIQKMTGFTQEELQKNKNIVKRLNRIYEVASVNPKSRIYVDAEQSFFQEFIESITIQYQLIYNKQEPMIYSTLQCYLKDSLDKIQMEELKSKEFGITTGCKLVKGAYLNEESHLPAKHNLNESYEATTEMYDKVAKIGIDNCKGNNELLFGNHNLENTRRIKEYMIQNNTDRQKCKFAQLLGMADHLSFSLPLEGFETLKYVPIGPTDIMIPYLCRRAYEGFKFISNVKMQEYLLKDELKQRIQK